MLSSFDRIQSISKSYNEYRDCVVKAFSLALDLPYADVRGVFSAHGRKARRGAKWHVIESVIDYYKLYGYDFLYIEPRKNGIQRYTPKTIPSVYPVGNYLWVSKGHMLAMIGGKVVDWTEGRRHRIIAGWHITKR